MTLDATATLVWLAPAQPTRDQREALRAWGSAHGLRLSEPADAPYPRIPGDPRVALAVEDFLDRARAAMAAADAAGVDAALAAAESLLRAHAELPQAAWLMAEVERARATRWRRLSPPDLGAADRAWARAEALDGGRAAGLGEEPSLAHPASAALVFEGRPSTVLWIDGSATTTGTVSLRAGPHALLVTQQGAPVWATWVDLPAGTSSVDWSGRVAPPCSEEDVRNVALADETIRPNGVRCGRWIAAEGGGGPGAVRVAACESDRCGPLVEWRSGGAAIQEAGFTLARRRGHEAAEHPGRRWPSWATWALVAAGVAIAAGAVVLASAVWRSPPSETRFVGGGLVNGP